MNPFQAAQQLGYGKEDILKYLSKANPNFSKSITNAMQIGYTSDQIMQYLSKAMAGEKVDPKISRRVFDVSTVADITKRARNTPEFQPKPERNEISKGIKDAATGIVAGGVLGGAAKAATGFKSVDTLVKAYQEATTSGISVPFIDFVKKVASGSDLKGAASSTLNQLQKAATEYLSSLGDQSDLSDKELNKITSKIPMSKGDNYEPFYDEKLGEPPQPDQPIQPEQPQAPEFGPSEAFDIIKAEGLDQTFDAIQANSPEEMLGGLNQIIGKPRLKELSKKYGKPIEEIVGNAFMMKQGGIEATQSQPLATELGVLATEPEVMANQLETMATEPQPLAIEPEVKPLDTEEKAKPSPFKSKEPTTDDEKAIAKIMEDVPSKMKATPLTKKDVKPIEALKSSNVRGATYHPDKTLQVVFESGQAYQYENVDKNDVQDFLAGASTTTTDGESVFRAFYSGKDKSIGSGFDKFIKKNADKYPPQKIDKSEIRDTGLNAIRKADQVEKASLYFDKFLEHNERAKSGQVKEKVKELSSSLKGLSDETENEIIYQIRQLIKTESSKRKKEGKRGVGLTPKNIAKEIDKRLKNG